MDYKVKDVSEMTGVSIRMLHHYHKIGLLVPDQVTKAGYRLYSDDNLARLQQIMFLRELDFSLEKIGDMLSDVYEEQALLLEKQQQLLEKKAERLLEIIETIKLTREKYERGEIMSNKDRFDSFDTSEIEAHKKKYAQEVEERWGGSDAYAQAKKRTNKYSDEDLAQIKCETEDTYREIVALMDKDVSDPQVQDLVASLRQGITNHFYDCTPEIFAGLGLMYLEDDRFKEYLDSFGEGFAKYLSESIAYYSK